MSSIFWICASAWFAAQFLKVLLYYLQTKKVDLGLFFSSGKMPSSHSAFVSALTMSVGLTDGFESNLFAVCLVFSFIVMYDAAGVRRAAGEHAAVINIIIENIENQGIKIDGRLKELLGHSPIEVISGAILGIVVALAYKCLFG